MSKGKKVDEAIAVLRSQGRSVGMAAVSSEGKMLIEVDGVLLTYSQLYVLAGVAE